MTPDLADTSTWETVLIRCPQCRGTVVPDGADRHQAEHFLWKIGEYMDDALKPVDTYEESTAMYVGSGRAMFFREKKMRWVGLQKASL